MTGIEEERCMRLRSPNISSTERYKLLQSIYDSFMKFDSDFVKRANSYVEHGIVDICFNVFREGIEGDMVKVVYILGMVCFNNESATDRVGAHPDFYTVLQTCTDKKNSNALLRAGLYLMTNASSNSFSTHPVLIKLLPRIREIIDRKTGYTQATRSEGVRVCFYLASNERTKAALVEAGVITPLIEIMSSGVLELDCVSAAIAVANLVGDEEENVTLSPASDTTGFYKLLVDALEASLNGTDYPVGSNLFYRNWKVVQGIANLSKAEVNKEELGRSGLIPQLKRCLDQDDTDKKLHEFAMQTLWQLSFHPANHALICETENLLTKIEHMSTSSESENVREAARGIVWQIDQDKRRVSKTRTRPLPTKRAREILGHVMCSYCWVQQDLMRKIKTWLEKEGYKTWVDMDNINGPTLESVSAAIEGAEVVLLGLSNDFRSSSACRTECEFALKLKKDIRPLILEKGFVPESWVALAVGSQQAFDFSDPDRFEETLLSLVASLGDKGRITRDSHAHALHSQPQPHTSSFISPIGTQDDLLRPDSLNSATTAVSSRGGSRIDPLASFAAYDTGAVLQRSNVCSMSCDQVGAWLDSVGLGRLRKGFKSQCFDGQSLQCANMIAQSSNVSFNVVKRDFQNEFSLSLAEVYKLMWNLNKLCEGAG
eukprot:c5500_g1_i1.p1 GENE.c5500_g1_i1~~c5500_g1_i1.p1  ORF type:complete len:658 (+),score=151.86 c5500_g1_i1:37-2010(+)